MLYARGIVSVPDCLANSGGILVAHFTAMDPSPRMAECLLSVRHPAVVSTILRAAAGRNQPPADVTRELAARNLERLRGLDAPPRYETVLKRIGNRWVRRFLPRAAEIPLIARLVDRLLQGVRGLEAAPLG